MKNGIPVIRLGFFKEEEKNKTRIITLRDFKLYYKAKVLTQHRSSLLKTHLHSHPPDSIIHNSKEMETASVPFNWWIHPQWAHTHNECSLALTRDFMALVMAWMKWKTLMLSEINQERQVPHAGSYIWKLKPLNSEAKNRIERGSQTLGVEGLGHAGQGSHSLRNMVNNRILNISKLLRVNI